MSKTKNYFQEKAEDFMHKVEQKVSQKKISKGCALMLCLAEEDIAWELVGFDADNKTDLKSQLDEWIQSIKVEIPWWKRIKDVRFQMKITDKDLEGLTDMQKLFIKILLEIKRKDN